MATTPLHPNDDPAADAAMLLLRLGLAIIGMAIPTAMAWSRRAVFILLPVGAALVVVAGVLMPDIPVRRRLETALLSTAGLCGVTLLGWSALSLVWSPVGAAGIEKLAKTAGTMALVAVATALLPERTRTANLNLFPLGILGGVAVTLLVTFTAVDAAEIHSPDSTVQRAVVTLVVLMWPALAAMAVRGRWAAAAVVAVAVMLAAMAAWTTAALAALALGAVAFAVATPDAARTGRVLGWVAALLILLGPAVPFAMALGLKAVGALLGDRLADLPGALDSMRVWAGTVVDSPIRLLTGHGLGMAQTAPAVGFLPPDAPRSFLFEIWYDFGLIGALTTAVLVRSAFGIVGRLSPTLAPFLIAEFVAMLTVVVMGLETTQLWWITLGGVLTLAFATVVRGEYRTTRPVARLEPQIAPVAR